MCLGDSYKHENSKDNEAKLGMYVLSDKEEKGGTVLDFKSENGQFAGRRESGEQPPARQLRNSGPRGKPGQQLLLGSFPSDTKVNILKVNMLRFPS